MREGIEGFGAEGWEVWGGVWVGGWLVCWVG